MKKWTKRVISGVMTGALLLTLAIPVLAETDEATVTDTTITMDEATVTDAEIATDEATVTDATAATDETADSAEPKAAFYHFSGTIKEIMEYAPPAGGNAEEAGLMVLLEDDDQQAYFHINQATYLAADGELEAGVHATGYYDASAPMLMIYPPRHRAVVFVVEAPEEKTVKFDRFNEALVSSDGSLKLNLSDETAITLQDGEVFEGSLTNRMLVVYYRFSTFSIPAQTTPDKIVVLYEEATPPISEITPEEETVLSPETELLPSQPTYALDPLVIANCQLVVEDQIITAPPAFLHENGVVMVPLRAICEALGYELGWDGELAQVMIGNTMSLTIGKDEYVFGRRAPYNLGTPPLIRDDSTFVPLAFFREVMNMQNAYVFENQIVINNQERME